MTLSSLLAAGVLGWLLTVNAENTSAERNEIVARFPNALKVESDAQKASFEFCPDDTCDVITAGAKISERELVNIGYLYLYFISGYTELRAWRETEQATEIANDILDQTGYVDCGADTTREKAICILRNAATKYNVKYRFVRYDENERHSIAIELPKK